MVNPSILVGNDGARRCEQEKDAGVLSSQRSLLCDFDPESYARPVMGPHFLLPNEICYANSSSQWTKQGLLLISPEKQ